jgi:hypothetical protein
MKTTAVLLVLGLMLAGFAGAQTYSNGPVVTGTGNGFGGANTSILGTGLTALGYGAQLTATVNNRLADDFTVPCGQVWFITEIRAYAFQIQPAATTTSTLTAANYRIWSGSPANPASTILHDYSAASQMTSTDFGLNCYRIDPTVGLLDSNKPIFTAKMMGNSISLPPGTYWLDVQLAGSIASGPFVPPIALGVAATTGNAIQYLSTSGAPAQWGTAPIASGSNFAQGIPFEIDYTVIPTPCFDLNITQAAPGAGIFLADSGGPGFGTVVNAIALAAGTFPNGWLYGLDIPLSGLVAQISSGAPFSVTLDAAGGYSIGPVAPPPVPISVWYVGILYSGASVVATSAAKTVTVMP